MVLFATSCHNRHSAFFVRIAMLLPGVPASAGFDDPIALLQACHGKVRHFAGLAFRLAEHLEQLAAQGQTIDAEIAAAAASVLRYFDIAAPLHHADEEDDLFPALRHLAIDELNLAMTELEAEHQSLARCWAEVRCWLVSLQPSAAAAQLSAPSAVVTFAQAYPAHADREEAEVYRYASRLPQATLDQLGRAMAQRRGAKFNA